MKTKTNCAFRKAVKRHFPGAVDKFVPNFLRIPYSKNYRNWWIV